MLITADGRERADLVSDSESLSVFKQSLRGIQASEQLYKYKRVLLANNK
jgi:hypothetical protein